MTTSKTESDPRHDLDAIRGLAAVIRRADAHAPLHAASDDALARFFSATIGLEPSAAAGLARRGAPRLAAYRALVHNRLRNVIADWIPRSIDLLGRDRFRADVTAFIETPGPRSPYLRDVPAEFVDWATPRWSDDDALPPFLGELARYELLRQDVRHDPRGGEAETGHKLELDWPIRCDGTARVLSLSYPVHRLVRAARHADDEREPIEPGAVQPEPTHLLVFRNRRQLMMFKELAPVQGAMLRRVLDGQTMREAIVGACADEELPLEDALLGDLAVLLARLAELGVVRGGLPPGA